jgi:hypothetical protein
LVGGKFVDEDPLAGTPGSLIPSAWGNSVTDEMLNVIQAAGLVPTEADLTQLLKAIRALGQAGATNYALDTGVANAYVAAFTPSITSRVNGRLLRFKAKTTNTASSTFNDGAGLANLLGLGGLALQGGEVVVDGICTVCWNSSLWGGAGAYVLLSCDTAPLQVAPASKSQHAIQLAQMAAVVGGTVNAKMTISAASASATFTADEVAVKSALGGVSWLLSGFNASINLGTIGAGGMDTGASPASGWVALYAIFNPTTGVRALLAKDATSAVQPEVYSGVNMPAGYTASALVAVLRTTGAGLFAVATLKGRSVDYFSVLFQGVAASFTVVSATACVPPNAKTIRAIVAITSSAAGQQIASICTTAAGLGFPGFSQISGWSTAGGQNVTGVLMETQIVAQQVYVATSTATTTQAAYNSYGYTF